MTTRLRVLLLSLAVAVAAGCGGSGDGTVTGEVTLDGQPLKKGLIRFVSADGARPTADAAIADGRFTARVPPGDVKVEITAPKVIGKRKMYEAPDAPEVEEVTELLPAKYNVRTELKMTVTRQAQAKQFELRSK